ncbi:hypothetical protein [Ekhidna sp.]
MYQYLLPIHSVLRWLILLFLFTSILRTVAGYYRNHTFTKWDNVLRHWTATVGHIQMIVGILLYIKSPIVQYYWDSPYPINGEALFFSVYHIALMILAIVILTIGSAMAKRKETDKQKFKTILIWYSLCLVIMFVSIPWPFSPFANRLYLRPF